MEKRFTEEQIIGFLREAESGLPIAELCRRALLHNSCTQLESLAAAKPSQTLPSSFA